MVEGNKQKPATLPDQERERVEERFRLALEAVPNAMIMIDGAGQIVFVNSQLETLFGYTREELLDQPVEVLVPEPLRPQHPAYRASFFASPQVRPMGARLVVASHWVLHKDEQGKPRAILEINNDITERKQMEDRLTRLATAVEQSGDSIIITDPADNIQYVNPAFEQTTGYSSAEVIG